MHVNRMSREQVQGAVSSQEVLPNVATEMAENLRQGLSQPVTANTTTSLLSTKILNRQKSGGVSWLQLLAQVISILNALKDGCGGPWAQPYTPTEAQCPSGSANTCACPVSWPMFDQNCELTLLGENSIRRMIRRSAKATSTTFCWDVMSSCHFWTCQDQCDGDGCQDFRGGVCMSSELTV